MTASTPALTSSLRYMDVAASEEDPLTSSMLWNRFKNRVDGLPAEAVGSSSTFPANFDELCREGETAELTAQIVQEKDWRAGSAEN